MPSALKINDDRFRPRWRHPILPPAVQKLHSKAIFVRFRSIANTGNTECREVVWYRCIWGGSGHSNYSG
jgi:hypothetical protein